MKPGSQEFANLANDAYVDRPVGVRASGNDERAVIGGVAYRILEHVNDGRTGYQGTIYQRLDTQQIIVAHRGTEQVWKDGVVTDGSMVVARVNPQADQAVELTRRAVARAEEFGRQPGARTPEVTVTGHSLGGTLAQVSAHHFNLSGETFNAYGAASLDRRIPEGGNRVLNHVMAADTVSAASPHYGQVRIYAQASEITVLRESGYHQGRLADLVTPDLPIVAAGRTLSSHSMHHFLPVDGAGKPDQSMLADPAARERADANRRAIADFRGDVEELRRGVTIISRGPGGLLRDGVDHLRGPLEAGEPAARDQRREQEPDQRSAREPAASPAWRGGDASSRTELAPLFAAARGNDPSAMRLATLDLQSSPYGQAWQERVDNYMREAPEIQRTPPRAPEPSVPPLEIAR